MMNFDLTGMQVFIAILVIVAIIIAAIYLLKTKLSHKDPTALREEFLSRPTDSPLKGLNKYPQVDVFKDSGTYFGIGLVTALLLTFLAFNWTQFEKKVVIHGCTLELDEDIMVQPPPLPPPLPPPPPPPPPIIEEVPDEGVEEKDEPEFEDQSVKIEEKVNTPPPPSSTIPAPPPPKKRDEIFIAVEEMPRFPGCENETAGKGRLDKCSEQKLLEFIYKYIEYPTIARETGLEGRAIVQFVVDKNGSVSNVKVLRDIGGGCGDEAKRVVELMNKKGIKWKPGRQQGQSVRVQYVLPVVFKLE